MANHIHARLGGQTDSTAYRYASITGRTRRIRTMIGLGLSLAAVAWPAFTVAQPSQAEIDFFREMKDKLEKNETAEKPVAIRHNSLNSGYYRFAITKVGSFSSDIPNCNSVFQNIPKHGFLHTLFDRRLESGVAAILPLGQAQGESMTAEVNLFRWKRSGGRTCRFELSHFERGDGTYAGPWIPIDHNTPGAIAPAIKFRPWVTQSENAERKAAFWTGISAFATLLGPVGNLFFGDTDSDRYAIRSQTELSLFGDVQTVETGEQAGSQPYTFERSATVKPVIDAGSTQFVPKSFEWKWQRPAQQSQGTNAGATAADYARFAFKIEYMGSLFSGTAEYPDLSNPTNLTGILSKTIPAGMKEAAGKQWQELGGAFENLRAQDSGDGFKAACRPAIVQLTEMGLSPDDARLLLYAQAKTVPTVAKDMAKVPCLTSRETMAALERFSVPFDLYEPITDKTVLMDVAKRSQLFITGSNNTLASYATGNVTLYDMSSLLGIKVGDATVGSNGTSVAPKQFADLMKGITGLRTARCRIATLAGAGAEFPFPNTPGGDEPLDAIIVHLGETAPPNKGGTGKVAVIALGFAGKAATLARPEAQPVLTHYWIGTPDDVGTANWDKIRPKLAELKKSDGCDDADFQAVINPPPPPPAPAPLTPATPVAPTSPDPVAPTLPVTAD